MIEIAGHENVLTSLNRILITGLRTPLLFTGSDGCGKFAVSLWFASLVNCERPLSEPLSPCGKCISCRKIKSGNHPDVRIVEPDPKTLNIRLENVRELHREASYKPLEGKFKVFIMRDAHRMLDGGANAYLKLLEEPAEYIFHILTSTGIHRLFPTIVSRCLRLRFLPVDSEDIEKFIVAKYNLSQEKAQLCASISQGSPGLAANFAENEELWNLREKLYSLMAVFHTAPSCEIASGIDSLLSRAENNDLVIKLALFWLKDLLGAVNDVPQGLIVNTDFYSMIKNQSRELSNDCILRAFKEAEHLFERLDYKVSPLLAADAFLKQVAFMLSEKN